MLNLAGAGGDGGGGRELVRDGVLRVLVLPAVVVLATWVTLRLTRKQLRRRGMRRMSLATFIVPAVALLTVPALGAWSLGSALQIREYLAASDPSLDLSDYYVIPEITATPSDHTNLVLIYLESIEDAFADAGTFGVNMLESIQQATEDWQSIPNLY